MKRISSWTNLQDVFKANEGQGQRMADDVFGSLEAEGQKAQQRLSQTETDFRRAGMRDRNNAFAQFSGATSANQMEQAGQRRYAGPRTLSEFDPGVSNAIGDAAARINASPTAQFQQQYKASPLTAGGSALDMALMNQQGGGTARSIALKGKYGNLLEQFGVAARDAADFASKQEGDIGAEAARLAGKAPEARQQEALAKRAAEDRALWQRNEARRAAYEREYAARNARFRSRRGNEIQAAYQPPDSEVLPFYPAS